jgi:hypothetical protein
MAHTVHLLITNLAAVHLDTADITGGSFQRGVATAAGNVFLGILSVMGAIAIAKRKMIEMLELAGLATLAALLTYQPGVIQTLADGVKTLIVH